jgi:hypothetical protein
MKQNRCWCGQVIHQDGMVWTHVTSGARRCYPWGSKTTVVVAAPRPVEDDPSYWSGTR